MQFAALVNKILILNQLNISFNMNKEMDFDIICLSPVNFNFFSFFFLNLRYIII